MDKINKKFFDLKNYLGRYRYYWYPDISGLYYNFDIGMIDNFYIIYNLWLTASGFNIATRQKIKQTANDEACHGMESGGIKQKLTRSSFITMA